MLTDTALFFPAVCKSLIYNQLFPLLSAKASSIISFIACCLLKPHQQSAFSLLSAKASSIISFIACRLLKPHLQSAFSLLSVKASLLSCFYSQNVNSIGVAPVILSAARRLIFASSIWSVLKNFVPSVAVVNSTISVVSTGPVYSKSTLSPSARPSFARFLPLPEVPAASSLHSLQQVPDKHKALSHLHRLY